MPSPLLQILGLGVLLGLPLAAQDRTPITAVRIEGLTGLTEEEVLTRLGGRLDFITSRPPSRSRADDADFLVSRLLEKEGYSDVNITWRIPADRGSIVLTVESGPRLALGTVAIQGVSPEVAETMEKYFTGTARLGRKSVVPYLREETEDAARNAVTFLKAQGYWEAQGSLAPPVINPSSRQVSLTLEASPGPLHTIASLDLQGPLPSEIPNVAERLQRYLERPATAETLREIQEGATAELRKYGYQFAQTSLEAIHKNGRTSLTLILAPGQQYRLRKALLTGGEGIDLTRVQRLFTRSSGQSFDQKRITQMRNGLLATGAFDSIESTQTINEDNRAIDITLHLTEGKPKGISYYLGAGSLEGFIIGASYYNRNFLSKLYNFNTALEYSGIGFLGEISVTDPYFLSYELRATPRAFALTRTFDEYFKIEVGTGVTFSGNLSPRQTWELDAQLSYATVQEEEVPRFALGQTDYLLTTVGATWLYDRRNSKVSPTKGLFARARAELGAVTAQVPNAFLRLDGQVAYHYPLNEKSRLGFHLKTGLLAPTEGEELPIDLRYFLGGADSIRSFPTRKFGPLANGNARGGQAYWFGNAEYLRKIVGPLEGVLFADAGSLDESATAWPSFDPKFALGLGLRLNLPIGPIRFEYGHALNPTDNDPSGAFHFSIGASF